MASFTKMKGNHHLEGNVQVYNVRIPVEPQSCGPYRSHLKNEPLVDQLGCPIEGILRLAGNQSTGARLIDAGIPFCGSHLRERSAPRETGFVPFL